MLDIHFLALRLEGKQQVLSSGCSITVEHRWTQTESMKSLTLYAVGKNFVALYYDHSSLPFRTSEPILLS